ncbi:phosphatidate phosphatase LPIN2-like [Paramacrobiotus metropolitanus]|uniref:phosphatidate phosphatase LPIN2-like n=1 Tax=Paramacrobiotus metropolitanus TaxID=2943436 RepID=UPI0024459520|nr:phosphatidate phosphatase LPIN2-like [Paramacrobiotus metropolitanus]
MNYIGKFVSNIREFYNDLNPATLSGAIDVVIVEQEDGSYASSPFHVRFGKRGVFNRREKIVDITINGEPVELHMKLGETGEAFFVQQTEPEEFIDNKVPALLATSPLPPSYLNENSSYFHSLPKASLSQSGPAAAGSHEEPKSHSSSADGTSERLPVKHDGSVSPPSTGRRESADTDISLEIVAPATTATPGRVKSRSRRKRRPKVKKTSDEEIFKMDLSDDDRETTPVNETDRDTTPLVRTSSLPDISEAEKSEHTVPVDQNSLRNRRLSSHSMAHIPKHLHVTFAPSFGNRGGNNSEVSTTKSEGQLTPPNPTIDKEHLSGFLSDSEVDLKKTETRKITEDDGANVNWKWGQLPEKKAAETPDALTPVSQGSLESIPEASQQSAGSTADQEKRSYLRGMFSFMRRSKQTAPLSTSAPKDISKTNTDKDETEAGKYLSDLVESELSQSQKEKYLVLQQFNFENSSRSAAIESGIPKNDSFARQQSSQPSAIQPASKENVADKGLNVPATVEVEGKNIELVPLAAQERGKGVDAIVNAYGQETNAASSAYSSMAGSPPYSDSESDKNSDKGVGSNQAYKKTLRLTSEQIMTLPLQYGMNEAEFCIVTKYQGSARCKCNIFLWRYDDKIVISDIDGTITKSDVLGHILPIIGSTWAQAGVAGLYNRIANNGYKFLYLSSRAIGQASFTRDHLKAIIQENVNMPEGPLLLSPKSLFLAFHQEVIVKRPEEFKIACLKDIRALFPPDRNPFFAAYGNRTTDLLSYRTVGVPMTRIFTINYQGQLKHEILRQAKSSYSQQSNLVDMLFPPLVSVPGTNVLVSQHEHAEEYSSFVYWKAPLPDLDSTFEVPPPPEPEVRKKRTDSGGAASKSTSPTKTAKTAPLTIM